MDSPFQDKPEDLVVLQTTVRDWIEKARDAVWSFRRAEDGSYWQDTNQFVKNKKQASPTTTARCYFSLVAADRCIKADEPALYNWKNEFEQFVKNAKFALDENKQITVGGESLNLFKVAHLADFVHTANYLNRFFRKSSDNISLKVKIGKELKELAAVLKEKLNETLDGNSETTIRNGEVFFERRNSNSAHFFVTLHSLRALSILDAEQILDPNKYDELLKCARNFCMEQCFASSRKIRHHEDSARLSFAIVAYSLYATQVDKDLSVGAVEALAAAQSESGNWPATHPIFREKPGRPWFIASHEIALCLTWLYFQPRLPDKVRPLLLEMMAKYFTRWLIPTFTRVTKKQNSTGNERTFTGWFDDHTIGDDSVVGWATAIVCHFLANYHSVLADHINRRVIETLKLEQMAKRYLIDETTHEHSPKWLRKIESGDDAKSRPHRATWFDITPFAWPVHTDESEIAKEISWRWNDPNDDAGISKIVANRILLPTFDNPNGRPNPHQCAVMLPGPPGTGKTSLVKTLSEILQWPLVMVPASVIFDKGFDMMEARAMEVFRNLSYLTSCIIFFDEFEEFFRRRPDGPGEMSSDNGGNAVNARTIAAFTTSAMLPRLQHLHDQGRCLIFLATNHPSQIDRAILRPGRFDSFIEISHPNYSRAIEYLDRPASRAIKMLEFRVDNKKCQVHDDDYTKLSEITTPVKSALQELLKSQGRSKNQEIRFWWIEAALKHVMAHSIANRVEEAKQRIEEAETLTNDAEKGEKPYKKYKGPPPQLTHEIDNNRGRPIGWKKQKRKRKRSVNSKPRRK